MTITLGDSPQDTVVIIPAAGQGKRMETGHNKLLLKLGDLTILEHTINLFCTHPRITHIYLVTAECDRNFIHPLLKNVENVITMVDGGKERQDSVYNAAQRLRQRLVVPSWVLVHDGARPFCSHALIDRILDQCVISKAVIPVVPLTDTIRHITAQTTKVVDRAELFATQTPQGFQTELLLQALKKSREAQWRVTDDASLLEQMGYFVATVPGEATNLKITTPDDLQWARWWLSQQQSKSLAWG